jgi:hypothetical protein
MSEETKRNLSGTQKFSIALGSGIVAGFAAAVLSHVSLYFPFSQPLFIVQSYSLQTHSSPRLTKVSYNF